MWQYNYTPDYLCHWGIKGMKWGVRRYQNPDGSLTEKGRLRYYKSAGKDLSKRDALIKEDADRYLKNAGNDKATAREKVSSDVATKAAQSNAKYNVAKAATIAVGSLATLNALSLASSGVVGVAAGMGAYGFSQILASGSVAAVGSAAATSAVNSLLTKGKAANEKFIKEIGDEVLDEIGR